MSKVFRSCAVGAGLLVAGLAALPAVAQDEQERQLLLARVSEVINDNARHEIAVERGRERTVLCAQCHGDDGNSRTPDVPNLASQNPTYLLEQVEKFADGRRKNFVMQSLARSFTMEDKVNLAVYFASMPVKPVAADPLLAREGARIYETVCQMCHGDDGRGETGYARLAGQQIQYVITTLKRFRANAKARGGLSEQDMKRHDVRMEQVTQNLSDRDIEALAAYIALLR
ncbi:MAG: cytochrome c [Thiohalomonadaceae bacterium]